MKHVLTVALVAAGSLCASSALAQGVSPGAAATMKPVGKATYNGRPVGKMTPRPLQTPKIGPVPRITATPIVAPKGSPIETHAAASTHMTVAKTTTTHTTTGGAAAPKGRMVTTKLANGKTVTYNCSLAGNAAKKACK